MQDTESSKDGLLAHWEAGIPLDSAWVDFAVFFDRFALTALRTHPDNDADLLGLEHSRYKELSTEWLPKTWETRQKKLEITTKNERINLLREIYAGDLWAIGFRTLPTGSDELVRVPRKLFYVDEQGERNIHPDIFWSKGELTVGNVSYFDIRIVKPPANTSDTVEAEQPQQANIPATSQPDSASASPKSHSTQQNPDRPSRVGRPKRREQIRSKVEELWNTDPQFQAIPNRIDQAREVRARLCGEETRHRDDTPNYRSSTIQRIIGEVANKPPQSE
jgi:hypothetical protein